MRPAPGSPAQLRTGVTVPYTSHGSVTGPPIVLLHAWGESAGVFDRLIPALPQRYHALAFDQRGHGGATVTRHGYTLDDAADDVRAFLDAVGVSTAVLLGSSSGGYVAQQVAITAPTRVAGLILVGAPRSLAGRPPFADEVDALTDPIDPAWVRRSLEWFPRFVPIPDRFIDDRVRDGVRAPALVWREVLSGLASAEPPSEAGAISCPTLILSGEKDDLIPAAEYAKLAAAIPGSSQVRYANTGHLVLWERPERVAADVTAFLSRDVPAW